MPKRFDEFSRCFIMEFCAPFESAVSMHSIILSCSRIEISTVCLKARFDRPSAMDSLSLESTNEMNNTKNGFLLAEAIERWKNISVET